MEVEPETQTNIGRNRRLTTDQPVTGKSIKLLREASKKIQKTSYHRTKRFEGGQFKSKLFCIFRSRAVTFNGRSCLSVCLSVFKKFSKIFKKVSKHLKMYIRARIEPFLENKSWWLIQAAPKTSFEPFPNQKNSPLGPQKAINDPKIRSTIKVRN